MRSEVNHKHERKVLTSKLVEARHQLQLLSYEMEDDSVGPFVANTLAEKYDQVDQLVEGLESQYLNAIPAIPVSRCPFTSAIISLNIDVNGLDGLWWDAEQPLRPDGEPSGTLIGYTGSIQLAGKVPTSSLLLLPGPEVPWVCPRLLRQDGVKAVLSEVKIGAYQAFLTTYYAKEESSVHEGINAWGVNYYVKINEDGLVEMGNMAYEAEDYDYDLAKWIEKRKLQWIAPNDMTFRLQDEAANCPFVGVTGRKYPVIIQNGRIENALVTIPELAEEPSVKYCPNCGNHLEKDMNFCDRCGQQLI